jgi:ABC-type multidrug transport system fused ATPase/permease subunit
MAERTRAGTGTRDDPAQKPRANFSRGWAEARALMAQHRGSLAIGFALMLVNRLAGLVLPASSKFLIDRVLGQREAQLLVPLAVAAGVATLVQAVTGFALSQVVSVAGQRAIADMRKRVQEHVLRLPVSFFDSTKSGVLVSRIMTDAEGVRNLVGTGIIQLAGGLLSAAIALGVLFYLNWQLTLGQLVIIAGFGALMASAFSRLRPVFRERGQINAEVTGRLAETLGGIRIVKSYVAERRERVVFARGVHRLLRNVARTITGTSAVGAVTTVIVGAVGVLMIVVGGRAILAGEMTLGDFVMYVFFVGLVAALLVSVASIGTQLSEALAGLDRIRDLLSATPEDAGDEARSPVAEIHGEVAFEEVSFEYDAGVRVLHDVSFRAAPGSTTALVGSSGSGKSTLLSLVMGFNRPTAGRILVDGRDLASLRMRDFRSQIGVVLQDNFLFDGTIRDNIAFAHPGASDDEVRAAGAIAHCDEFVTRFADGYNTVVGERGVKLSGGQRQRVAIARAILADPAILILDEATSSLDSESEAMIRDGLRSLRRGRTTFVIAHRLSTIESADQILVLEGGRIVERGTHRELLALGGRYRQLHDRQSGAERDQFINPGEDFLPVPPSAREALAASRTPRPSSGL